MRSKRFERWFAARVGIPLSHVVGMWNGTTYRSFDWYVEIAWAAWQEAINGVTEC